MLHRLLFILFLLAIPACIRANDAPATFAVGQQWSYQTRKSEPGSRLVILRIDDHPKLGRIVHVGVLDATLRLGPDQPPVAWKIDHMPFPEAVLRKDVINLERAQSDAVFSEFEKFYAGWKVDADKGKKQFWNMPVAKALDGLETMIRRSRK